MINTHIKKENRNYDYFVEKFKPKKTSDDCYTPPHIYDVVLQYARERCGIPEDARIIRPFYPGKDYQNEDYSGNCVVVDNPPFSILSSIIRWYNDRGIRYFLFAPHLTAFSSKEEACRIIVEEDVVFENGARIKVAFITNLLPGIAVIGSPDLKNRIKTTTRNREKKTLPRYGYPDEVLTVSRVAATLSSGKEFVVYSDQIHHISKIESMGKKGIFGAGYLISTEKAREREAREREAAIEVIKFSLSPEEQEIVDNLSK